MRLYLPMVNVVGCNMEINMNRFSFEHFLINLFQYLQNIAVTFLSLNKGCFFLVFFFKISSL